MSSVFIIIHCPHTLRWDCRTGGLGGVSGQGERLVGGEDLVDPATELGDTGVDGRSGGGTTAASPGDDTDQSPGAVLLTDQRTARVALKNNSFINKQQTEEGRGGNREVDHNVLK